MAAITYAFSPINAIPETKCKAFSTSQLIIIFSFQGTSIFLYILYIFFFFAWYASLRHERWYAKMFYLCHKLITYYANKLGREIYWATIALYMVRWHIILSWGWSLVLVWHVNSVFFQNLLENNNWLTNRNVVMRHAL